MKTAEMALPAIGRWALGAGESSLAESMLEVARQQSLTTGWLGPEAGFVSNLDMLENLRLLHDWHVDVAASFDDHLQSALKELLLDKPAWLSLRPSQLVQSQLLQAALLRIRMLRPDVLVLSPVTLAQMGAGQTESLLLYLSRSRLLLLDAPQAGWPAWTMHDILPASAEDVSA